jgi:hypothetical protein
VFLFAFCSLFVCFELCDVLLKQWRSRGSFCNYCTCFIAFHLFSSHELLIFCCLSLFQCFIFFVVPLFHHLIILSFYHSIIFLFCHYIILLFFHSILLLHHVVASWFCHYSHVLLPIVPLIKLVALMAFCLHLIP